MGSSRADRATARTPPAPSPATAMDHSSCSRSRRPAASAGTRATSSTSISAGTPSPPSSVGGGSPLPSPRTTTLTRSKPRGAVPRRVSSVQSSAPETASDQTVVDAAPSPDEVKRRPRRTAASPSPRTWPMASTLREPPESRTGSEVITASSPPNSSARMPLRPLRLAERTGSQTADRVSSELQPSVFSKE